MKVNKTVEQKPVEQKEVEQPKHIEIPFSVVLHYTPGRGVSIIPIGVNLPHEIVIQMLDLARTEVIKAQLAAMKQPVTPAASGM